MRSLLKFTVAAILLFNTNSALAKNSGKLPKDAQPMASEEVKKLVAGQTVDYKVALYYFDPAGTLIGVLQKDDAFAEGKWVIKDNEFCLMADWRGAEKTKPPFHFELCKKYYLSKKTIYVENSKDDEKFLGDKYRYDKGEKKKWSSGDKVSKRAMAVKAKYGY